MGITFILIFILSNIFAYQQKNRISERNGAIVITSAATIKSTPADNGTDLFVLHEGTYVRITDKSMKDWVEIKLADGKEGWIMTKQIEVI